jgi:hypothetical protein
VKGASHIALLFITVLAAWQYPAGTFTYGSGDTKAELDEIIARTRELW